MVMKERDEELTLFLEMRRREKEKNNLLLVHNSNELDACLGSNGGGSPVSKIFSSAPAVTRKTTATENFLNSENDKSDYDWLLTPPGTPLFPSLEMELQKAKMSQTGMSNARPTALKPRLENLLEEPALRSNVPPKNSTLPSGLNNSSTGNRRPSSSGGLASSTRAATPTGRLTLTTAAKPSRPSTPTSRATLPSSKATAPAARSSTPTASMVRSSTPATSAVRSSTPTRSTARSSTPTARPTITASKPAPRSATPNARPTITASKPVPRSATPNARPTITASKPVPRSATPTSRSTSRSATPTRRASAPSSAPSVPAPPSQSSLVSKSTSATLKNPAPSRGTSPTPTVKSRPWKPSEMPGFSLDAPPNLRTTLPERPVSASRGRPGATSAQSSIDAGSNGRRRQQSCSPSRVRTSNGSARGTGSSIPSARKVNNNCSDDVNPVQMGTQMVERVVNMRKLAPPKQDYHLSTSNNSAGKSSSSLDSSGFGRTLSKKSLDMALRHMDIRRSISGNLRPLMTNIPASSMYSVRSGSTKTRTLSVSDSPLATSSNASSEPSVNNSFCLDESEIEYNHDFGSERGNTSPSSQRRR